MKTIKWGILGLGKISHKFAHDLKYVKNASLEAVASRDIEKAKVFAKKFNAKKYYGSYEDLAKDNDVDIIYIATPHTMHCENTLMCLENNKAVLCEKPFAINANEAEKMVNMARSKKLFLMEAMWTRFLPHIIETREIINSGILGKIKMLTADFGFKAPYDPEQRLFNLELGGGSLLDIGIYPLFLSLFLFGQPLEVKSMVTFNKTGVDESCTMLLRYDKGLNSVLFSTLMADTSTEAIIYGTNGKLKIQSQWFRPSVLELKLSKSKKINRINFKTKRYGYQFEATEAVNCLLNNKTESELLPLSFSIELINLIDTIKKQNGIKYKADS